ncbi:hypothetical protein N7499_008174 [Penicillium canescens]|uniref:beta-glucosidase n=1 Tax=Penicillium canescens TaxID=5083 RepID=A0AAD6N270_PENCN|nr:uncharacterized protein N7446_013209 [Penicillium canescens]KAJ5985542.1 hypothetical protein N7522_012738 [Penicillium canescens]KAJ6022856.1 hypothetical protein N7460_013251 [Penicillium canescens]KAJ6025882.1 hypothetical protein N7444_013561 [Penicillium canescens]KAJ6042143.1 hypothetical protein N7446_013209 [Penicillium canescens]KAJ6076193.1 hypothetical protein N7499_008174 [Penicillium canescens]
MRLLAFSACIASVTADVITSDSHFYGQSPPVYPSPTGTGTGDWAESYTKAKAFVAQLSLEEKSNLTFGASTTDNGCSGFIPAISRLGFPGLCLSDAGNGLRSTDLVNGYPAGLSVGASWNRKLTTERAHFMAGEFKAKGINIALGPVVGPLGRVARNGRNWEGFSNDPYLSGVLAADTVTAFNKRGVMTSLKHYIMNEQETNRNPITGSTPQIEAVSSNVDDKTIHELYLWPFQDAIKAGSVNIMCSYNRINNSYGCANSKTLNGLLKTELGFQGFVVTDWTAQHSGVASALAGLDMVMPDTTYWGNNLTTAINNGSVPESRLNDMATRILAAWYYLGQDSSISEPGAGMPYSVITPHKRVDARDPAARPVILQGAVEGHVLVKNNHALPLKKPQVLSVFGYSAATYKTSVPSTSGLGSWALGYQSTDVQQIMAAIGRNEGHLVELQSIAINGTIIMGGGSGAATPTYVSGPLDALTNRAMKDNSALFWDVESPAPEGVPASDACLVFINAWASEGYDRPGVYDDYSDNLVLSVADQCDNTIVVIHNAGVRLVDNFADHPNVTAIVYAHTPGQDSGAATVALLYGDENFSGKMPYSVPKNISDYGALLDPSLPEGDYVNYPQSDFSEGIFIDYRDFESRNITPRYEFGFGLSYTSFEYGSLSVTKTKKANNAARYPSGAVEQGGQVDLWDVLARVKFTVKNTGPVAGKEAAQLYIDTPSGVKQLRGFEKVSLNAGEKDTVTLALTRRDLSEWDVVAQKWRLVSGKVGVYVGASLKDLRLQGTLHL